MQKRESARNDDKVIYDVDGDSTGGIFNLMPDAGDTAILRGLVPRAELDLMV